jgi:hypothetical protein
MVKVQGPPVAMLQGTDAVCTLTPSLQLTVMATVNVSVAVMVRASATLEYAWKMLQGLVQVCAVGS